MCRRQYMATLDNISQCENPFLAIAKWMYQDIPATLEPTPKEFYAAAGEFILGIGSLGRLIFEYKNCHIRSNPDAEAPRTGICVICMTKNCEMMFKECSHVVTCVECAAACDTCPVCRGPATEQQRVYVS